MHHRISTALITTCVLSISSALASDIPKKPFHLNEKMETEIGYAQAVRIGDTLYISGSVGAGEMPTAIRQAYDELKRTLAAHGLDFRNVVKENVFATDLDAFIKNKDVRKEFYGRDCPAATWAAVEDGCRLFWENRSEAATISGRAHAMPVRLGPRLRMWWQKPARRGWSRLRSDHMFAILCEPSTLSTSHCTGC